VRCPDVSVMLVLHAGSLRSAATRRLVVPSFKLPSIGSRALPVSAAICTSLSLSDECRFSIVRPLVPAPTENVFIPVIFLQGCKHFSGSCRSLQHKKVADWLIDSWNRQRLICVEYFNFF